MPDIKYKTISCGPAGSFQPEDIRFNVSAEEASALVEGGYAVYVRATVREQAVVAPVEHAVGAGNPFPVQPPERTDAAPIVPQPQPGRSTPPRRGGR